MRREPPVQIRGGVLSGLLAPDLMLMAMAWRASWHRPVSRVLLVAAVPLIIAAVLLLRSTPFSFSSSLSVAPSSISRTSSAEIWSAPRAVDWKPCHWWTAAPPAALPPKTNGFIRVDCFGGLNQMRRDLCDGIGIARLLNATLVLPKFEVAAYWNESSGFSDVFDVDYFIEQTKGFVEIVKDFPVAIAGRAPFRVDCSKRKGLFDYTQVVLPALLEHRFVSITPAMSQRRDRYPLYAKAALCQGCYKALRLNKALEAKGLELLDSIPKPFLSLHLRFEPDMVAYSQCEYDGLSESSLKTIEAVRGDRKPWTGNAAHVWRGRGKCPLTPNETAFILQALGIPTNTTIYLAAGDGLMEIEGFTSVYTNVHTKASLLSADDFVSMHGNTKAALDYYVSINSEAYIATYFGNMDKMVSAMRALKGMYRTLVLSRRDYATSTLKGLTTEKLAESMRRAHWEEFVMGRGTAIPDCFCEVGL